MQRLIWILWEQRATPYGEHAAILSIDESEDFAQRHERAYLVDHPVGHRVWVEKRVTNHMFGWTDTRQLFRAERASADRKE